MPKPSPRVRIAIVMAASSDRPNESSNAESCVALMKSPPVLQRIAAPRTSSRGEELIVFHLSFDIYHWSLTARVCWAELPLPDTHPFGPTKIANEKSQMTNDKSA